MRAPKRPGSSCGWQRTVRWLYRRLLSLLWWSNLWASPRALPAAARPYGCGVSVPAVNAPQHNIDEQHGGVISGFELPPPPCAQTHQYRMGFLRCSVQMRLIHGDRSLVELAAATIQKPMDW